MNAIKFEINNHLLAKRKTYALKRELRHGERAISKNSANFRLKADIPPYITGRQALLNS